jgi:hypothetical protein
MAQQFGAGVAVPPPPITGEMRESARANPNSWLYVIDPAFDATADVPQWAVVGAYPVAADGRIEDDRFAHNDTYRPSPRALGWPVPTTALERIVQLANAGHRPAGDLPAAVLDATLLVYVPTALAPTELAADAAALPTLTACSTRRAADWSCPRAPRPTTCRRTGRAGWPCAAGTSCRGWPVCRWRSTRRTRSARSCRRSCCPNPCTESVNAGPRSRTQRLACAGDRHGE